MLLKNVNIIGRCGSSHISIKDGEINEIITARESQSVIKDELTINFDHAIAFPGLINSHDHLEFNLFPRLGNRIYKSYLEWGEDIHRQNKEIIDAIVKIPKRLRVQWGIYKNLLNGVTTVVQHGEYFEIEDSLIDVFQDSYSLHSVRLEKNWKLKLNNPFSKNKLFVLHIGEGTDHDAFEEMNMLNKWNLFTRKIVAIHGVAMNEEHAKAFEALIWCPDSNFFLLGATAKVTELKKHIKILFGTDSTLSAGWNLWEQIRLARKTRMLTDEELFDSLTSSPSLVWGLADRGNLSVGKKADVVVAVMKNRNNPLDNFLDLNPEDILLVIKEGRVILLDGILSTYFGNELEKSRFSKILINKVQKFVKGDLQGLIAEIEKFSDKVKFPVEMIM
jgi:cytosine/adenosine deaminase-related metal-dependent hydrolase